MAEIDTILDNQEVNAQTLNDIAIDLGHTSFNGFGENKFGADELNGITSALVSSGILSSDNKCKPYISGGKVYISTGTMVFANGAKKKISEVPVEVDLIANSYIYALNDTAHNVCKIIVSEEAPADGDFVNLCEIAADGTLIDKRMIAKAKVELPTEGNSYIYKETISGGTFDSYDNKTLTFQIQGISKIFISTSAINRNNIVCMYEYDIATQTFVGLYNTYPTGTTDSIYETILKKSEARIFNKNGSHWMTIDIQVMEQTTEHVTFSFEKNVSSNGWSGSELGCEVYYYVFGGVER